MISFSTGLALKLTPLSEALSFLKELSSSEHLNLHQHLCKNRKFLNLYLLQDLNTVE